MPIASRRYKAPVENGAVLAEPPLGDVPALVAANRTVLAKFGAFRVAARQEVLVLARQYTVAGSQSPSIIIDGLDFNSPLLLSGHQPELSHPGVWAKNFALHGIAQKIGGLSLNLVVDNDTLKTTALKLPTWDSREPRSVRLETVPFDTNRVEQPYEVRDVEDYALFESFAERAASHWQHWGYTPMLPEVWRQVLDHPAPTIGERFAVVRRAKEREWGCHNLELPVSHLSKTVAFQQFVGQIVRDLPRFTAIYNDALHQYRSANQIRSKNHPAPDLEPGETPFWRMTGAGRTKFFATEHDIPELRPRALTLTLFARLFLGDFFIHGIGGGKYDEVTDAIIRDFYGIEPPLFQVLSATVHLPLPTFPTTVTDVLALRRRERDLHWNPQRHLPKRDTEFTEVQSLVNRHHLLEAVAPSAPRDRQERYRNFREISDQLRPRVEARLTDTRDWLTRAEQEATANAALVRRDFAWVLYPEAMLRPIMQQFL